MQKLIRPGMRTGTVYIPASKSHAHRLLICAGLSTDKTDVLCEGMSKDISATMNCLNALGARIENKGEDRISVSPIQKSDSSLKHLKCGESGSTLRFLLPVVGALGETAAFHREGLLSKRPMDALTEVLEEHGMKIWSEGELLLCSGQLKAGEYTIAGNISSQYISGLLFALPLLEGDSILHVTEPIESVDYITMTEDAIRLAGIHFEKEKNTYHISGNQRYRMPEEQHAERDWSNAAFFLSMGALSDKGVTLKEMTFDSSQGDKDIVRILESFGAEIQKNDDSITVRKKELIGQCIDAARIPDLVPVICVVASVASGETIIRNAGRLRFKESDRIQTTIEMLTAFGADIKETEDGMIIRGKQMLDGGETDTYNDHRIAMSSAVAALVCKGDVVINGAECVQKSYPGFWNDFESLEVD